jgi:hypothetical protein
VQIGEAGFALLCKRHTYVDNYNSILVFTLGHGVTVGSSWLHFMKKCGVHCHSAVDVDFDSLQHCKGIAFFMNKGKVFKVNINSLLGVDKAFFS